MTAHKYSFLQKFVCDHKDLVTTPVIRYNLQARMKSTIVRLGNTSSIETFALLKALGILRDTI